MPTTFGDVEVLVRQRLNEPTPKFWSSAEIVSILIDGAKDMWRSITDLKQEHYLTVDTPDVTYQAGATELSGVPQDVHKLYMIEPRDSLETSANVGLQFRPLDFNHPFFQRARTMDAVNPSNTTIYYSLAGQGGPVGSTRVLCAPRVTANVNILFAYVPTLPPLEKDSDIPIPGESTNALVAWGVAYARAKEREDRAPDPGWLSIYGTEKQSILQSLGIREYQEPKLTDATFEEYWG